jgi:type 2A phosphatase activator TIP41
VALFEDEFGDKGYTRANVRYRVMDDCFFVLLRSYVRIDSVIVRILDTRLYHEFGSNRILRDFSHMEATYEELK